jgi:phage gpG-like protein
MKEFHSFGAFAAHLLTRVAATSEAMHLGLRRVAEKIEHDAKEQIGHYQEAVGPFPEWAPLAESTVEDRIAQGYSPDEPLLRKGDLRDSIKHEVGVLEAVVGSTSPIAPYQELGTDKIPPRPFIGPAAFKNKEHIHEALGVATVVGIAGGKTLDAALGYNFTTKG